MPNPVETFAAKTAGKAAGLRARAQGLTGVFNVLAQQHKEAAILLGRAKEAREPEKRRELWAEVRCELICHERAELSTVYPVIGENPLSGDITSQHADEAVELESAMARIDALGYESSEWQSSLQRLISLVQQHADHEEHEFFPRAQDTIGKEAAAALERPFLTAKAQCRRELG